MSKHLSGTTKGRGTRRKGKTAKLSRLSRAMAIKQVGAKFIGKQGKTKLFSLDGGVFTEKQIVGSRIRFGKIRGIK